MAGQRQPIDLVIAKGKKNLTKTEIAERKATEVPPLTGDIIAPNYLTKAQKKEFDNISNQLQSLNIMSETDVDALARFILSRDLYVKLSKQMNKKDVLDNPFVLDKYMKNQDRAFKQCRASAIDLGLTISSRCKLVVPPAAENSTESTNKFIKFEKKGLVENG